MDWLEVRLECLRLALQKDPQAEADEVVRRARTYAEFVTYTKLPDELLVPENRRIG